MSPRKIWLNGLLFAVTVFTSFYVGLSWSLSYVYAEVLSSESMPVLDGRAVLEPRILLLGGLYAVVLLTILTGHELGHYLTCRRYGIRATLPYFIPAPTLVGTLGAFIRIKSPITRKHQLFDIGAAGPLMSFLLSLPALAVGLALSKAVPALPRDEALIFGEPLLFKLFGALVFKGVPEGYDVVLHPVGFAGWVGILVTAFNLFPVGQLDGGHIAYAIIGRRARNLSKALIGVFVVMGVFFWVGWIVWGLLIRVLGIKHPPVDDEWEPLDPKRRTVAVLIAVIFVLSFIPDPVRGFDGVTLFKDLLPFLKERLAGLRIF